MKKNTLNIIKLGRTDYGSALKTQERTLALRQQGIIQDTLLMTEHTPVLTVGKNGKHANILASDDALKKENIEVFDIGRGGDVTYHGAGQIVGYPIVDLSGSKLGIKQYVEGIEEVFIRLLKQKFGIDAHREDKKYTGVWVGDEKITAIGIAVKRGISMHGFAFNVNTNLSHFGLINPCGITDKGVTSLEKLLGSPCDFEKLTELTVRYFCEVFGYDPISETTDILNGDQTA